MPECELSIARSAVEVISSYGAPYIFNTDQGTHFTSDTYTGVLKAAGTQISMDGKGCWVGNVSNCKTSRIIMAGVTYKLGRRNIEFSL